MSDSRVARGTIELSQDPVEMYGMPRMPSDDRFFSQPTFVLGIHIIRADIPRGTAKDKRKFAETRTSRVHLF